MAAYIIYFLSYFILHVSNFDSLGIMREFFYAGIIRERMQRLLEEQFGSALSSFQQYLMRAYCVPCSKSKLDGS